MLMPRDPLHRLLAVNGISGAVLAAAFVVALFWLNIAGLGALLGNDREPALVVAVVLFGFVITFASVMMGTAIMMQSGKDDSGDDDGHGTKLDPALVPVRAHRNRARR
jgi:hypothetical protein